MSSSINIKAEIFSAESLSRLGDLEDHMLEVACHVVRFQNRDDQGVALRYLARVLSQYALELDMLQEYLDQFEATLNLLEARA